MTPADRRSISSFFSGRQILITGGTGFIGAVLLEKLLRSCPDVTTVYLLVRPRDGLSVQDRVKLLFREPVSLRSTVMYNKCNIHG